MSAEEKEIDPEIVNENNVVEYRRPDVPVTLDQLAALKGEAIEVFEARLQVLETARKCAIRMTHPTDWSLFRDKKTGLTVGYLDDAGCDRVRDILGIEIFGVGIPQKVTQNDGTFMYVISASGRCKITRQVVEAMEGGRSSKEDFCKDLTGTQKELAVRKAARANLDGGITRELAGLRNVPLEELESVWKGTGKSTAQCRQARGFGSSAERQGAQVEHAPDTGITDADAPACPACGLHPMKFKKAGTTKDGRAYGAFWSCKGYPDTCKTTLKDEDWQKQKTAAATTQGAADVPV